MNAISVGNIKGVGFGMTWHFNIEDPGSPRSAGLSQAPFTAENHPGYILKEEQIYLIQKYDKWQTVEICIKQYYAILNFNVKT